jgi:2-oxoglutarate ferredoxin oxidoreductase subunit alpha
LKQEGISYLAGCELPAVVINMVRGGPGLGNIAPAQSDYFQATRGGGHGDYRTIVLAPSTVQEVMELTILAFELADRYRMPAMILGDGLLGQMMEPVEIKSQVISHKSQVKKPWTLTGCKDRKPRVIKSLLLGEGELEALNRKLQARYRIIEKNETRCETLHAAAADVILIGYGSIARILKSVIAKLRKDGIKAGLIRPITLWPFPYEVIAHFSKQAKKVVVVEMSEGQMLEDVRLAVGDDSKIKFYGRSGGGIPTEEEIIERIKK